MEKLKPCPFCGSDGTIHVTEKNTEYTRYKKEIPAGSRILREIRYPDGHSCFEYRKKAFAPQCSRSDCIGRTRKLYENEAAAAEAWNRRMA